MYDLPDNIGYYEGEWRDENSESICPPEYHWVRKHVNRDGVMVEGHCAKNPVGTERQKRDAYRREMSDSVRKYSSYRQIEEDLHMSSSDAQAWAEVHTDRLKGSLKKEVDRWNGFVEVKRRR